MGATTAGRSLSAGLAAFKNFPGSELEQAPAHHLGRSTQAERSPSTAALSPLRPAQPAPAVENSPATIAHWS